MQFFSVVNKEVTHLIELYKSIIGMNTSLQKGLTHFKDYEANYKKALDPSVKADVIEAAKKECLSLKEKITQEKQVTESHCQQIEANYNSFFRSRKETTVFGCHALDKLLNSAKELKEKCLLFNQSSDRFFKVAKKALDSDKTARDKEELIANIGLDELKAEMAALSSVQEKNMTNLTDCFKVLNTSLLDKTYKLCQVSQQTDSIAAYRNLMDMQINDYLNNIPECSAEEENLRKNIDSIIRNMQEIEAGRTPKRNFWDNFNEIKENFYRFLIEQRKKYPIAPTAQTELSSDKIKSRAKELNDSAQENKVLLSSLDNLGSIRSLQKKLTTELLLEPGASQTFSEITKNLRKIKGDFEKEIADIKAMGKNVSPAFKDHLSRIMDTFNDTAKEIENIIDQKTSALYFGQTFTRGTDATKKLEKAEDRLENIFNFYESLLKSKISKEQKELEKNKQDLYLEMIKVCENFKLLGENLGKKTSGLKEKENALAEIDEQMEEIRQELDEKYGRGTADIFNLVESATALTSTLKSLSEKEQKIEEEIRKNPASISLSKSVRQQFLSAAKRMFSTTETPEDKRRLLEKKKSALEDKLAALSKAIATEEKIHSAADERQKKKPFLNVRKKTSAEEEKDKQDQKTIAHFKLIQEEQKSKQEEIKKILLEIHKSLNDQIGKQKKEKKNLDNKIENICALIRKDAPVENLFNQYSSLKLQADDFEKEIEKIKKEIPEIAKNMKPMSEVVKLKEAACAQDLIQKKLDKIKSAFSQWQKNVITRYLACATTQGQNQKESALKKASDENHKEMQDLKRKIEKKFEKIGFFAPEESERLKNILAALEKYEASSRELFISQKPPSTAQSPWRKAREAFTTSKITTALGRLIPQAMRQKKSMDDSLAAIAAWSEYSEKQSISFELITCRTSEKTIFQENLAIVESILKESKKNDDRAAKSFFNKTKRSLEACNEQLEKEIESIEKLLSLSEIDNNSKEIISKWMSAKVACHEAAQELLPSFAPSFSTFLRSPIINDKFRESNNAKITALKSAILEFKNAQNEVLEALKRTSTDIQKLVSEKNISEIKKPFPTSTLEHLKALPKESRTTKTKEAVEKYLRVFNMATAVARTTDEKTAQQYYGPELSNAYKNILSTMPKKPFPILRRKTPIKLDLEKIKLYFPAYSPSSETDIQAPHSKDGAEFLMTVINTMEIFERLEVEENERTERDKIEKEITDLEKAKKEFKKTMKETRAKAEVDAKAKAAADAKAKAEADAKAKAEADAKAKAEVDAKAKAEADAKAKAAADKDQRQGEFSGAATQMMSVIARDEDQSWKEIISAFEAAAKPEAQAQEKRFLKEQELQARSRISNAESEEMKNIISQFQTETAAADARTKAEAEARAKAEAQARTKAEAQARTKAEAQARAKAEVDAKAKAEADARTKAEAQARTKAEADARAKAEADAKAKAEAQARTKAEAEARTKAEADAKAKAEAQAQARTKPAEKAEDQTRSNEENAPSTTTDSLKDIPEIIQVVDQGIEKHRKTLKTNREEFQNASEIDQAIAEENVKKALHSSEEDVKKEEKKPSDGNKIGAAFRRLKELAANTTHTTTRALAKMVLALMGIVVCVAKIVPNMAESLLKNTALLVPNFKKMGLYAIPFFISGLFAAVFVPLAKAFTETKGTLKGIKNAKTKHTGLKGLTTGFITDEGMNALLANNLVNDLTQVQNGFKNLIGKKSEADSATPAQTFRQEVITSWIVERNSKSAEEEDHGLTSQNDPKKPKNGQ